MQFTIRQARKHAELTQAQMAKKLGVDRSTYIKIEKDVSRATVGQVNLIAKATNIPLEDIFLDKKSTLVEFCPIKSSDLAPPAIAPPSDHRP